MDGKISRCDAIYVSVLLAWQLLCVLVCAAYGFGTTWLHQGAQGYWFWHTVMRRGNVGLYIQAIGSSIAVFGLLKTYVRVTYDLPLRGWLSSGGVAAQASGHGQASATAYALFNPNPTASLRSEFDRLATFVNNRSQEAAQLEKLITDVQRELSRTSSQTAAVQRDALKHIQDQIDQLTQKNGRLQLRDLTWAIWGLVITVIGTLVLIGT